MKSNFTFLKDKVLQIVLSENECEQIKRAANDLVNDFKMVFDNDISITRSLDFSCDSIFITSVQNDINIKFLDKYNLDLDKIRGKRECYIIHTVSIDNSKVLCVIGSDMRGTIYGIYNISKIIGVSPYYWWADVVPKKKSCVTVSDLPIITNEPSVEYRGIFINDERNLQLWSRKFVDKSKGIIGTPNSYVYKKVFELLLRLNANTIWPAMHPYSTAFNKVEDSEGVPINAKIAHEYGIILGTSHCENMLRNNVGEWHSWAKEYKHKNKKLKAPKYDYSVNPNAILDYWQERLDKNKQFENIYTLGMRGIHDGSMSMRKYKNPTLQDKIELTNEIIGCQRNMLSKAYNGDMPMEIFVPYKEAANLYNGDTEKNIKGINLDDDVTLMWSDDNHGYIRQLPNEIEKNRKGGNGVYYHISYWGYPCSYLWINSTPLGMVHREFLRAYNAGIRKIFIINVGDIKPCEISLAFQMQLLSDIKQDSRCVGEFLENFARETFELEGENVNDFADIVLDYYRYAITLRPEFLGKYDKVDFDGKAIYNVANEVDEGEYAIRRLERLEEKSSKLLEKIDKRLHNAYFEMIHYSIISYLAVLKRHIYYQKHILAYRQHRYLDAKMFKEKSKAEFDKLMSYVDMFDNIECGKWKYIMQPYIPPFKEKWNIPLYRVPNIPLKLKYKNTIFKCRKNGILSCYGGEVEHQNLVKIYIDNLTENKYFSIYKLGKKVEDFDIKTSDFISLSELKSDNDREIKYRINVDWDKVILGLSYGYIDVSYKSYHKKYVIVIEKFNEEYKENTFVENNYLISVPAYKYDKKINTCNDVKEIYNVGRSKKAVLFSGNDDSAKVTYSIYFHHCGEFLVELSRIPSLNEGVMNNGNTKTCNIGLQLDDGEIVVLKGCNSCYKKSSIHESPRVEWRNNAYRHIEYLQAKINVKSIGYHTITVHKVDNEICFDRIVCYTNGTRNTYLRPCESYNTFLEKDCDLT